MSDIDAALTIATKAHLGQKDKAGMPYILHPLRLMMQCDTEKEKIVAVLHDVVEDSDVTIEKLRDHGFSVDILDAIDCLTKKEGESYEIFIRRIATNELAKKVKIIDIQDNLNISRLKIIADKDIERIQKYHQSLIYLYSVK